MFFAINYMMGTSTGSLGFVMYCVNADWRRVSFVDKTRVCRYAGIEAALGHKVCRSHARRV